MHIQRHGWFLFDVCGACLIGVRFLCIVLKQHTPIQTRSMWDLKLGWGGVCYSSYCHVTLCCTVPSSTRRCTMAKHRVGWWKKEDFWLWQNSLWIFNTCRDISDFTINEISFCACIWVQDMEFYNVMDVLSNISSWTTSNFGLYGRPYTPKNDFLSDPDLDQIKWLDFHWLATVTVQVQILARLYFGIISKAIQLAKIEYR